jgi:uncharacterized protein (DUF2336 family)
MRAQTSKLNIDPTDVKRLVSHPDRDVRAVLAQKVCRQIRSIELSAREREIVAQILHFIAKDAAAMVRRALAVTLKNSPNLPRDIAKKLIKDVDSIAAPVLTYSPVLTDEDLLDVLKSKAAAKILAISKRERIKGNLVKAILRYGDSHAVAAVAANDGAELGAELGSQMLEMYHDNDLVKESFIMRRDLPPTVVEKLITLVSSEMAIRLNEHHEVPIEMAIDLANRSRERASIDFISQSWVSHDLGYLVARLETEGRLTKSLIIRAACCGQIPFTEHAFAQKTGISLNKARLMVHDSGPFGLKALCKRAGLSEHDNCLIRAAITIYRDLELKGAGYSKEKFQTIMLERVLSLPIEFSEDDYDYLFEKLDAAAQKNSA